MHSIRLERVAFGYSDSVLVLRDVDAHFAAGFTGLVGRNGAGKSTLLHLVAGQLRPTSGTVVPALGAVVATCPQTIDDCPASARELAEAGDGDAGRLRSLLDLDVDQLARWSTLSPGERRRWQIGGALAKQPDVLLLDEPTNHVDARCRQLLVGALRRFAGIGIVIAHDRRLLDELTTSTVRLEAGTATQYPAPYSDARSLWEAEARRASDLRDQAKRVVKHAESKLIAARRDRAAAESERGGRTKKSIRDHDASSMGRKIVAGWAEDRHGRTVEVARREVERATAAIPDGPTSKPLGRSIFVGYERCPKRWLFELDEARVRAGDHAVLRDVRVAIGASDRVRIAGDNGAGKTTLIRALLASRNLPAGDELVLPDGDQRFLVLPQELPASAGPELVRQLRATPPEVRGRTLQLVAALGADPDRVLATSTPSPGETRKLALALGLARHAWCVILDEPTNHFDLPSIERLEEALAAFPGAIVVVSHDDAFAARLTTTTWRVRDGGVVIE